MTSISVPEPVMSLAVAPRARDQSANFSKALNRFTKEDPTFKVGCPPFASLFSGLHACLATGNPI